MGTKNREFSCRRTPKQIGNMSFARSHRAAKNADDISKSSEQTPFLQETGRLAAGKQCNYFEIEDFQVENGSVSLDAELSMTEKCKSIQMCAELYETNGETPLVQFSVEESDEAYGMCYTLNNEAIGQDVSGKDLVVVVNAEWETESGEDGDASVLEGTAYDDADWEVNMPKIEEKVYIKWKKGNTTGIAVDRDGERTSTEDKIVIALYREADDMNDMDYLCLYEKDSGGRPWLMVPGDGTITFKDSGIKISQDEDKQAALTCYLKKAEKEGGVLVVSTGAAYESSKAEISTSQGVIRYKMNQQWEQSFVEPGNFTRHEFAYHINLSYYKEGSEKIRRLRLGDEVKGICIKAVPHLIILWGCLEENTLVRMADGIQKKIKDIVIGDKVMLSDGSVREVKNKWKGTDMECCFLRTESGMEIKASKGHPFLVLEKERGQLYQNAENLQIGDMVQIFDGSKLCMDKIVENKRLKEETCVYNLDLGAACMVANGFVCGDMKLQNQDRE